MNNNWASQIDNAFQEAENRRIQQQRDAELEKQMQEERRVAELNDINFLSAYADKVLAYYAEHCSTIYNPERECTRGGRELLERVAEICNQKLAGSDYYVQYCFEEPLRYYDSLICEGSEGLSLMRYSRSYY